MRPYTAAILRFPLTRIAIGLMIPIVVGSTGALGLTRLGQWGAFAANWWFAAAAIFALVVIGHFIEGRPRHSYGLGGGVLHGTALGVVLGATTTVFLWAILALGGWYQVVSFHLDELPDLVLTLVFFVATAVVQVVIQVGIVFRCMEDGLGSWLAMLAYSVVSGVSLSFNPHVTQWAVVAAIVTGFALPATYIWSRALWVPLGLWWSAYVIQGPILGMPESGFNNSLLVQARLLGPTMLTGGAFDPIAGLFGICVDVLLGALFMVAAVNDQTILTPAWLRGLLARLDFLHRL